MKLLNAEKTELAVLDEGTTKVVYYGKDPALIYFEMKEDHGKLTEGKCTIKKIEALDGYIKTDAGSEVKIEGTLLEKINILETVLGCKLGYSDGIVLPELPLPNKTIKFYSEKDTDDAETIKITVTVDSESKVFEFTRGPNAVTVKDVLAKLTAPEGKEIIGVVEDGKDATEENALGLEDKLLEDQALTAVIVSPVTVKVKKATTEEDTDEVTVQVPYKATVDDALKAIAEDETVKGWIEAVKDTYTFKDIVRADGTTIGTKAKKAAASTLTEVKLTWTAVAAE